MVKTTKTLKLTFLNGKNKKTSVTLGDAMTTIAQANVFEKDGVAYYSTPQSTAYIERTVSDIFNDAADDEAESADKQD